MDESLAEIIALPSMIFQAIYAATLVVMLSKIEYEIGKVLFSIVTIKIIMRLIKTLFFILFRK